MLSNAPVRWWFATLAIVAIASGCRRTSASDGPGAAASNPIVARLGKREIRLADVDARIANELYELRGMTLERIVAEQLLAEGETDPEKATEEQLRRLYDEGQRAGRIPEDVTFEAARKRLASTANRAAQTLLQEKLDDKALAARVAMNLDALGRPRVPMRPGRPEIGPRDARIVIYEYTDFESPFGAKGDATVQEILQRYPRDVRIVFRQKPEAEHAHAREAAAAALCADEQDRYMDYRRLLFAGQKDLGAERLKQLAREVGLDRAKFEACLKSDRIAATVSGDIAEAKRYQLEGTPVFSMNGTKLSGAHDFRTFRRIIAMELEWFRS